MNKKQTSLILVKVKSMYPQHFKGLQRAEWQIISKTWTTILCGYEFEDVNAALDAYIATGREFAPNPGQIKRIIDDRKHPQLSAYDAWQAVRKSLSNAGGYPESAFKKLPEPAKQIVGSPATLRQWAMTNLNDIENYIKPRFIKEFKDRESDYVTPIQNGNALEGSEIMKKLEAKMTL